MAKPNGRINARPTLIIPVESQVRELDAKLLLACFATERGYPVILGSRAYVHFEIGRMPQGIYIAKSMRSISDLMFSLIRKLGHDIVAWEEEALVHPPADVFYPLRLSPQTIRFISHLFAWGPDNEALILGYPELPDQLQIHVTGNPRGDMLRPELAPFFTEQVQKLRDAYGQFILINTNFTDVNPYLPGIGLFAPSKDPRKPRRLGQAGKGMPRPFAEGLELHKQRILDDFLAMIPALEKAFPGVTIVIRPHPSEEHRVYHELAARCSRVVVNNEGNVLPWLLACKLLVHNGCTTAAEAYAMGVPAVSYLKTFDQRYDIDFQGMPNQLSQQCFGLDELITSTRQILSGQTVDDCKDTCKEALIDRYVAARSGQFASERILDILDQHYHRPDTLPAASAAGRLQAKFLTRLKAAVTRLNMQRPGPNRQAYHDHRFPPITVTHLEERIQHLGQVLQRFEKVRVQRHSEHVFSIGS
jgi:surface carbohydrate biosynthesis protein